MKCKVMLARFPGDYSERPPSSNWVMQTLVKLRPRPETYREIENGFAYKCDHDRIDEVFVWWKSDTPITMTRNLSVREAKKHGVDYLLMIDNDMAPDQPVPGAKPFWETAFDFLWGRGVPAVVGAPYVGPGFHQNVYVFRWQSANNWAGAKNNHSIAKYGRAEASRKSGIEQVAALPTGLILYDMRLFERMKQPMYYYEMTDDWSEKLSTEDVTNTRDIAFTWSDVPGAGVFCAWDCWAEHIKLTHFGKPDEMTIESLGKVYRDVQDTGFNAGEKVVAVGDDHKGPTWETAGPDMNEHFFSGPMPTDTCERCGITLDAAIKSGSVNCNGRPACEQDLGDRLKAVPVEEYANSVREQFPELVGSGRGDI